MTAQTCSTCIHWTRHRVDANWGRCGKIGSMSKMQAEGEHRAYVHAYSPSNVGAFIPDVSFHTRDMFDCSLFERKLEVQK